MSEESPGLAPVFPPPYGYVSIGNATGGVVVIDVRTRTVVTTLATGQAGASSMAPLRTVLLVSGKTDVHVIQPAKTPSFASSFSIGAPPLENGFLRDGTRAYFATFATLAARVDMPTFAVTKIMLGFGPGGMVVAPDMILAWMPAFLPTPFPGSWAVFALDIATDKVVSQYDVDEYANFAVITPDSRFLYLSHAKPPHVTVLDTATGGIVASIPTGASSEYSGMMAITPDGTRIYVGIGEGSDQIAMIDVATNKVTDRITMPSTTMKAYPFLAVTPDNRYLCAAYSETGRVWVVDTVTNAVVPPDINVGKDCSWITFGPPLASHTTYNFYVAEPAAGAFSIDPDPRDTVRLFSTHPTGGTTPFCLAPSPDGRRLYIANQGSNDLAVIDLFTNTALPTRPKTGRGPLGVAVSPDSATIYVADNASHTLSVFDAKTLTLQKTEPVGSNPVRIAVAPDGAHVYVANSTGDSVSVVEAASNSVIRTITGFDSPLGLAVSPDGKRLYVCNFNLATVSVIDTASFAALKPIPVGAQPSAIAISPDGQWIYVTNTRDKTLSVIEAATATVLPAIPVGDEPVGVAVSPDGREIRVTNSGSSSITSLHYTPPKTWSVTGTHSLGSSPAEVRAGKIWVGYPE